MLAAISYPHHGWREAAMLLAAAPLAYYVVATVAALRFFRRERARKLRNYTPLVSILKPVRGADAAAHENFASFCRLDYPEYEILFGVNDENDPAIPVIQEVISEYPEKQIRVLIGADFAGSNRKVNKLARLAAEARHEVLVLSDGDVRVGPSFLREIVAPLADERTGAVTCLYRGLAEKNLGAEIEAIGAASDFFAGVLVAEWMEGMTFALGASIATTKRWIKRIGGFEGFANQLADDYELGHRVAEAGGNVVLCREPVSTIYPAQTLASFWNHQVRWARTVRLCRPLSYIGLIFTHGLPWALLAAAVAPNRMTAVAFLLAYLVLRTAMAWTVGAWGVGDEVVRRKAWLLPLRDAIHFVVWLASFASNRVVWGGEEYTMEEGVMVAMESESSSETNPVSTR